MITNLVENLIGVAIGIRYRPNFTIEDSLGKIIDNILYSRDSFFNPEMFPDVLTNHSEKILVNKEMGHSLRVNNSDIILELGFIENISEDYIKKVNSKFKEQIIDQILKEFKITQINRIGHIRKYLFTEKDFSKLFLKKTLGDYFPDINDISLRFSKKLPKQMSLIKDGVNDYINVIYQIVKKADRNELFISTDYQLYYLPYLERASQIEYEQFINGLEGYNKGEYLNWINDYYGGSSNE